MQASMPVVERGVEEEGERWAERTRERIVDQAPRVVRRWRGVRYPDKKFRRARVLQGISRRVGQEGGTNEMRLSSSSGDSKRRGSRIP